MARWSCFTPSRWSCIRLTFAAAGVLKDLIPPSHTSSFIGASGFGGLTSPLPVVDRNVNGTPRTSAYTGSNMPSALAS